MLTKSPVPISGTFGSTLLPRKPADLFQRSRYALAEQPEGLLGLHGAVILKPMTLRTGGWRENEQLPIGTVVPAEITSRWPLRNRIALETASYVRYFQTADEAEQNSAAVAREVRADPIRARIATKSAAATRRTATRAANAHAAA